MLKSLTKAPPFCNEFAGNSLGFQARADANNRVRMRGVADILSARQWLAEGVPIADVLTILEVRRRFEFSPNFARVYAVEILSAARTTNRTTNKLHVAHRKEPANAVA